MVHTIPINKARINLGSVVKRVHLNKEYFILEKTAFQWPVSWILTSLKITWNSMTPRHVAISKRATKMSALVALAQLKSYWLSFSHTSEPKRKVNSGNKYDTAVYDRDDLSF